MFSRLRINQWPILALLPMKENPRDKVHPPTEQDKKPQTGWDRVTLIFKLDEFGNPSKEMVTSYNTGLFAGFIGGGVAGLKESQVHYQTFVTKLNSEMFTTHTEAKSALTRLMAIKFSKACFTWGVRLGFFSTMYTLGVNMLAAYNDKIQVWNFIVSGLITGSIYRIPLGIRAMTAAGLVGGFAGAIAGCLCIGILAISGTSYDEIQEWHNTVRTARAQKYEEVLDTIEKDNLNPFLAERADMIKKAQLEALKSDNKNST